MSWVSTLVIMFDTCVLPAWFLLPSWESRHYMLRTQWISRAEYPGSLLQRVL